MVGDENFPDDIRSECENNYCEKKPSKMLYRYAFSKEPSRNKKSYKQR
jgi:hypothetical protein